jgi:hypothetical protein
MTSATSLNIVRAAVLIIPTARLSSRTTAAIVCACRHIFVCVRPWLHQRMEIYIVEGHRQATLLSSAFGGGDPERLGKVVQVRACAS